MDADNGIWAIFGARMGCHLAMLTSSDHTHINDYDYMENLWHDVSSKDPLHGSNVLGHQLSSGLGLDLALLSEEHSRFFKGVYMNPPRPYMPWDAIKHFMAKNHV
jgi:hypothetical protein